MGIISISLNDRLEKEIDLLGKKLGFSGRSELIRHALRLLINEEREKIKFEGEIEGIILLLNKEESNDEISRIRHNFNELIKTQIHNHLKDNCFQIFIIRGEAEKAKEFYRQLMISKKAELLRLIVI